MGESTIVSLATPGISIVLVTQIFTSGFITFKNQGNIDVKIKDYTILVNGTLTSFIDLQSELYSEKNMDILVNVPAGGSKRIKFITANGISYCVEYG
jgi:archaellum component FlaF (FlaF/FlaG flagellin family)